MPLENARVKNSGAIYPSYAFQNEVCEQNVFIDRTAIAGSNKQQREFLWDKQT